MRERDVSLIRSVGKPTSLRSTVSFVCFSPKEMTLMIDSSDEVTLLIPPIQVHIYDRIKPAYSPTIPLNGNGDGNGNGNGDDDRNGNGDGTGNGDDDGNGT